MLRDTPAGLRTVHLFPDRVPDIRQLVFADSSPLPHGEEREATTRVAREFLDEA